MEKRNDYNKRTPCRRELYGDKFCDCSSCSKVKMASTNKSIYDVDALSEKHNEQQH
jgi:hypothetical protein